MKKLKKIMQWLKNQKKAKDLEIKKNKGLIMSKKIKVINKSENFIYFVTQEEKNEIQKPFNPLFLEKKKNL